MVIIMHVRWFTEQQDGSRPSTPLRNMSAETIADVFVRHWIAKYDIPVPLRLTTDRGA